MTDAITDQRIADVAFDETMLIVTLEDRSSVSALLANYPRLRDATAQQRGSWQVSAGGYGVHWPEIDEDVSVERLLSDAAMKAGDSIRIEDAARLAEQANLEREVDPATASPDYLDGYQAGYEKAAAIIRRSETT